MCIQAEAVRNPFYHLTEQEINDPYLVLRNLFAEYHLPELREVSWEFLKAATCGSYFHDLTIQDRLTLFSFYEWIVRLLEAVHLLNEREKEARKIIEAKH